VRRCLIDQETTPASGEDARQLTNAVVLCGRVAVAPQVRDLPSGDVVMTTRLIVDRDPSTLTRSRQRVDTIGCVGWAKRVQRSMRTWQAGDTIQVEGALRRRFFRTSAGPASRVEVEVHRARRVRKAGAGE
jgi:single-strand DNA-binding protein